MHVIIRKKGRCMFDREGTEISWKQMPSWANKLQMNKTL